MKLPVAKIDRTTLAVAFRTIETADSANLKSDTDNDLGPRGRIILRSPNGTRYALKVSDAGALTTEVVA